MNVATKVYHNAGNRSVLDRVLPSTRTVLDVGCGAGDNARALAAGGCRVDGITLSEPEAELARQVCRSVHVFNLEQGLPGDLAVEYDCCICSHVLEHICWPDPLLAGIRQKLRPKAGYLIVALPNIFYFKQRWQLLWGRFEYAESGLMDNTHFRWYTLNSGAQLLKRNGFDVLESTGDGSFPLWPLRRPFATMARRIDRTASEICPGLFAWQLLFVARPR